jgi:AAA15 family ATPase/GTPase
MLIEFSVANFRSFRERQTLSMVAAARLQKRENVFKPDLAGEKFPSLLKACVIYGPNASGKSNLLRALQTVGLFADRQPAAQPLPLPVSAFRFDPALANQPSVFETHFITNGMRYQFDLSATVDRIVRERLVCYPKGIESLLYERTHAPDGDKYVFGSVLGAEPDLLQTWQKLTPPQTLFIAQAVANSSENSNQQLRTPFGWLKKGMMVMLSGMKGMASVSQDLAQQSSTFAEDIALFLQDVDVPVSQIKVEVIATAVNSDPEESAPVERIGLAAARSRNQNRTTTLTHFSALGEADIDYREESDGTQNLIGFWLPWTTRDTHLAAKSQRRLLAVDELDNSLHPKIVATLVAKHLASPRPTQLIFTTHDTHLMDAKLLRRDQFWIAERDGNGATQLRAIHDFEGREGEDIEKRYFAGRYRGLPQLRAE